MPTRAKLESVSAGPPHLPFGDPSQLFLSAHLIGERSATPFFSILTTQTSSPAALPLTLMENIQSDPGLLAPSSPSLWPLPQCRGPTLVLSNPLAAWALASALVVHLPAPSPPPCPLLQGCWVWPPWRPTCPWLEHPPSSAGRGTFAGAVSLLTALT